MQIKVLITVLVIAALFAVSVLYAATVTSHVRQKSAQPEATHSSGVITGRVVDAEGLPVSEADVYADNYRSPMGRRPITFTDRQGMFSIEGLAPGTYTISTAKESAGYAPTDSLFHSVGSVSTPQVAVYAQQTTAGVEVQLGLKAAKLTGRIVDAITNKPLRVESTQMVADGPQVILRRMDNPDYSYSLSADRNGEFKVLVPSVPFTVEVSAPGYKDWHYQKADSDRLRLGPDKNGETLHLASGDTRGLAVNLSSDK